MIKLNISARVLISITVVCLLFMTACQPAQPPVSPPTPPAPSPTPLPKSSPAVTATAPSPTATVVPATPQPNPTASPTPTPTAATPASVTINLTAQNFAFSMATITVPAGAPVLIHFTNKDSVPHNFALYQDSAYSKSIFIGTLITSSTTDYKFTAPTTPGTYFFRCDYHPSLMTGSFIVQ